MIRVMKVKHSGTTPSCGKRSYPSILLYDFRQTEAEQLPRVNIEREALDLPLVDLFQAFGMALPKARPTTNSKAARSEAEDMREAAYLRGGTMYSNGKTTRSEVKGSTDSDDTVYGSLLNHDNLALGAIERVNVAHRVTGKPELTKEKTDAMSSNADNWVKGYWGSSMKHGTFWTTDQVHGEPNFIEGGQVNGYGFVQSTYHKRHCLANLRMMLAWHIAGDASKMTNDMNVHAIHCLVSRYDCTDSTAIHLLTTCVFRSTFENASNPTLI